MKPVIVCALGLVLLALAVSATSAALADAVLDIVEVRADGFPRVVLRLSLALEDDMTAGELTAQDFRVVEDGEVQPSAELFRIRNSAVPASVIMAIDTSGSMNEQDRLPQARAAARAFLAQMRPRDQVGLITFGSDVTVRQAPTSDRQLLLRAINGLAPAGDTRLYDALVRGAGQAGSASGGTRAVVVLTDGQDTQSSSDVDQAIRAATRLSIPIYTIGLGAEVQGDVLQRIAQETGGRYYHAPRPEDLERVFRLVSRQLSSQYDLFWQSRAQGQPGREVPIQVSLTTPSGTVAEAQATYRLPRVGRPSVGPATVSGGALTFLPEVPPPNNALLLAAGILAGLAVTLVYVGIALPAVSQRLQGRLATYVARTGTLGHALPATGLLPSGPATGRLSTRSVAVTPLTGWIALLAARLLAPAQLDRLRRNLIIAGLRTERHLRILLAAKVIFALLLPLIAYAVLVRLGGPLQRSPLLALALIVPIAGVGFYLPNVWLGLRMRARRRRLARALPDALDLMTIGVSAGLSLDAAMQEIVLRWDNEFARELGLVLNEMRMGISRRQALLNLVERTEIDDIRLLVASLIQADELGTSLAETLAVQAEQLRIRRRQYAEEQAQKAPIKMLFPLIFLIFPALFVVILGPAVLQIVRFFRGFGT
jgi:tight adherence protein C